MKILFDCTKFYILVCNITVTVNIWYDMSAEMFSLPSILYDTYVYNKIRQDFRKKFVICMIAQNRV